MKNGKKQKARPKGVNLKVTLDDDDDVYYYIGERLTKARRGDGKMGVCAREWNGMTAGALMATPCTNSLGGESGGHKHKGGEGRKLC